MENVNIDFVVVNPLNQAFLVELPRGAVLPSLITMIVIEIWIVLNRYLKMLNSSFFKQYILSSLISLSKICLFNMWVSESLWLHGHQASLSMGFSRQEYWSGLPFPSPGSLPNPGIEPRSLPHCRRTLYRLSHQGSPICRSLDSLVGSKLIC